MARPREFIEVQALEAAMECFWSRGYEATSMRELSDRMGLTNASVYNTFGDKRTLFHRAFEHYIEHSFGDGIAELEASRYPLAALRAFFDDVVECSLDDACRKGCFVVNCALEIAPHDPDFRQMIAGIFAEAEAFFARCVRAGQAAGSISNVQPADDLARLLLGLLLGIRVLARSQPERELLEGLVRPAFALLDPIGLPRERMN